MTDKALEIVAAGAEYAADSVRSSYEFGAAKCESPIERIFLAQFLCPKFSAEYDSRADVLIPPSGSIEHVSCPPIPGFFIWPQIKIGSYRVDFVCGCSEMGRYSYCIVECDGHDWHERTKEQAARDKSRDRYLASQGFVVLRFTGSEIFNDPWGVASEVYNILLGHSARDA